MNNGDRDKIDHEFKLQRKRKIKLISKVTSKVEHADKKNHQLLFTMTVIIFFVFMMTHFSLVRANELHQKNQSARRDLSIIVTNEGYYPEKLTVFKGEVVRIFLTSLSDEPTCLIMPTQKIFLSAIKGKLTGAETVFENKGKIKFYCPNQKISGEVVVLEKDRTNAPQPSGSFDKNNLARAGHRSSSEGNTSWYDEKSGKFIVKNKRRNALLNDDLDAQQWTPKDHE